LKETTAPAGASSPANVRINARARAHGATERAAPVVMRGRKKQILGPN